MKILEKIVVSLYGLSWLFILLVVSIVFIFPLYIILTIIGGLIEP